MRTAPVLAISILVAGLALAPAYGGPPGTGTDPGADPGDRSLSERLDEALRGLMEQMKPVLDELLETLEVLEGIDSIEHYQRPEMLPNGDIIMRRREDAPPLPPPLPRDGGEEPAAEPGLRT